MREHNGAVREQPQRQSPPREPQQGQPSQPSRAPSHKRGRKPAANGRDADRELCVRYEECLTRAALANDARVCSASCSRYARAYVVVEIPVRTNWAIEATGDSNRRSHESRAEDLERHVRSMESRPLGSQVPMPWRLASGGDADGE